MEGNLCLKIDWTSLIVGSKFTVFALFYFVFEGNFPSTSRLGAYICRGDLKEGFLRYEFGGLIFGGAYTWRGLLSEFFGILLTKHVLFAQWTILSNVQFLGQSKQKQGGLRAFLPGKKFLSHFPAKCKSLHI